MRHRSWIFVNCEGRWVDIGLAIWIERLYEGDMEWASK